MRKLDRHGCHEDSASTKAEDIVTGLTMQPVRMAQNMI